MDTKQKVLLVEDNDTYRKVVKLTLEISGFEVYEAADGQKALEVLKTTTPHIILSDIYMPNMDGIAFLQEIKKNESLAKVPVIMLTNVQEEIDHSVKLGANEALLKSSITPTQVVDICRKHLAEVN